MPALRSARGGHRLARPADYVLAVAAALALPSFAGLLGLIALTGAQLALPDMGAVGLRALLAANFTAYGLFFSPLYAWIGLLIAAPVVPTLLWLGWFGWLSALAAGALIGAAAGGLIQDLGGAVGPLAGGLAALAFRGVLRLRRPEVFIPC